MSLLAGYMVPHPPIAVAEIGRGEEKKIQASLDAFDEAARDIARIAPETIVLTSPHAVMYRNYFHISPGKRASGDFRRFRAPQVKIRAEYDAPLAARIASLCAAEGFPAGTEGEREPELDHGTMVPLYFINRRYTDYRLVRIGLSGLSLEDHVHFGEIIRRAAEESGRRTVFVASGDLSHCQKEDGPYGFRPEGPEYDRRIMDVMGRAAFGELTEFDGTFLDRCMECGHRSFAIMGGAFGGDRPDARTLAHEATFGVGYGFVIYHLN